MHSSPFSPSYHNSRSLSSLKDPSPLFYLSSLGSLVIYNLGESSEQLAAAVLDHIRFGGATILVATITALV